MPKSFLIDTSRCTACRGCQIACKEWHELPANKTYQVGWGSHQNPQDLNPNNYKLVRFHDYIEERGMVRWNFFPDQCRHCLQPPCKSVADYSVDGAITQDAKTGAVIFTDKSAQLNLEDRQAVRDACPYDIPRWASDSGPLSKCTMCNDRVKNGMLPACVKSCPTGTMNFGEREDMLKLAESRLAKLKQAYPKAILADPEDVSVIYLLTDEPGNYHTHAVAENSATMDRKQFLAGMGAPFRRLFKSMTRA